MSASCFLVVFNLNSGSTNGGGPIRPAVASAFRSRAKGRCDGETNGAYDQFIESPGNDSTYVCAHRTSLNLNCEGQGRFRQNSTLYFCVMSMRIWAEESSTSFQLPNPSMVAVPLNDRSIWVFCFAEPVASFAVYQPPLPYP